MLTMVFDLDGTLIDTAPDLIGALDHVLAQHGLPSIPFETARNMIGGGSKLLVKRALSADGRGGSAGELDRIYADFIAYYAAHIADRSRPFPQLEATLCALSVAGHRLAVCTNKLELLATRLLTELKLARHFVAICGQDTFGVQKPDPKMLQATIACVGGTLTNAIMVGDSGTDIRTARAADVPIIAVDFGYSEVPIATLRPDRIISSFAELPDAVAAILAERQ
jgi:phosphoglycolate phosphatase